MFTPFIVFIAYAIYLIGLNANIQSNDDYMLFKEIKDNLIKSNIEIEKLHFTEYKKNKKNRHDQNSIQDAMIEIIIRIKAKNKEQVDKSILNWMKLNLTNDNDSYLWTGRSFEGKIQFTNRIGFYGDTRMIRNRQANINKLINFVIQTKQNNEDVRIRIILQGYYTWELNKEPVAAGQNPTIGTAIGRFGVGLPIGQRVIYKSVNGRIINSPAFNNKSWSDISIKNGYVNSYISESTKTIIGTTDVYTVTATESLPISSSNLALRIIDLLLYVSDSKYELDSDW